MCVALALVLFIPILIAYLNTGLVMRVPTVILCTGLILTAGLLATAGLILDTTTRTQLEIRRLLYLNAGREGGVTPSHTSIDGISDSHHQSAGSDA